MNYQYIICSQNLSNYEILKKVDQSTHVILVTNYTRYFVSVTCTL